MREPKFNLIGNTGVWEFAGPGPTVVFAHATGFHGRCWDQIVARLPDDWRILSLDLRGHGRAPVDPTRPVLWKSFGRDVAELAGTLQLRDAIGVGHSMGGHAVTLAAALQPPGTYAGLVLVDPVIRPAANYGQPWFVDHFARKRRNHWASADEMFERYRNRAPFDHWLPQMLRDYCDYALRGHALACDPDFEACIYEESSQLDSDIGPELAKVQCPVVVLRSHIDPLPGDNPDMNWSPCDPRLAERLPNAVDRMLELGHFIPMEAPDLTAQEIRGLASKVFGLADR